MGNAQPQLYSSCRNSDLQRRLSCIVLKMVPRVTTLLIAWVLAVPLDALDFEQGGRDFQISKYLTLADTNYRTKSKTVEHNRLFVSFMLIPTQQALRDGRFQPIPDGEIGANFSFILQYIYIYHQTQNICSF